MQFTINKKEFVHHLNDVQRAISSKTAIAILAGIKINVTTDGIYLTGSDSNISIEKIIAIQDTTNQLTIEKTGKVVVISRLFIEIIKKLPDEMVSIKLLNNQKIEIKSGKSTFTINTLDADLYPIIDNIDSDNYPSVSLPTFLFKSVLAQTIIAASTSENRPILTGVHLVIENGQLIVTATDSHRMSKRIVNLPQIDTALRYNCVIPARSLNELTKILSDDNHLTMVLSETKVLFISENLYFYSRLLEGNYPDVSRLLNQPMETNIVLHSTTLLNVVDRVALLSNESGDDFITLKIINNDTIEVVSESSEIGNVIEELTPLHFEGKLLKIAFNPNYMKDALRVLPHQDIVIGLMDEGRPFTIYAKNDEEKHFIQLITPIRTRN